MQLRESKISQFKKWCRTNPHLAKNIDPKVLAIDIDISLDECMEMLTSTVRNGYGTKFIQMECPNEECKHINQIDEEFVDDKTECVDCGEVFTPRNYINMSSLLGFAFSISDKYYESEGFNPMKYIDIDKKEEKSNNVIQLINAGNEKKGVENEEKKLSKTKRIFMSHSSLNKEISSLIVNLLEDIGVDLYKDIYYSSYEETGAKLLNDCLDSIEEQFNNYDMLVIFLISKEFYESKVCLAETGATWVTSKNNYLPIILPPYDYSNLGGILKATQNSIFLGDEEISVKLESFKKTIEEFLEIKDTVDSRTWSRKKEVFIENIKKYNSSVIPVDALLKDIKAKERNIVFKTIIKNNTKDRIKLEKMCINILKKNGETLKVEVDEDILDSIVIKPLEDIAIYSHARNEEKIRKADINTKECDIDIEYCKEE